MLRRSSAAAAAFAVVLAAAVLTPACAGGEHADPCKRALARLVDECGYEDGGYDDLELNCSGQAACVAGCLENAPCEDIANNSGEFADCYANCQ